MRRLTLNAAALAVLLVTIFPVYWMFLTAFKPTGDIQSETPTFWPSAPTLEHFATAVTAPGFWTFWRNSLLVTVVAVLLALVVALLAAFAVARMRWRGRGAFVVMVFAAQMAPWEALLVPVFIIARDTELLDSLAMLTGVYFMITLPFTIVALRGFLAAIPPEQPAGGVPQGGFPAARARVDGDLAVRVHHRLERVRLRQRADHQGPRQTDAARLAVVLPRRLRHRLGRDHGRGQPVRAAGAAALPLPAAAGGRGHDSGRDQGVK
jgi:signal transduction histidine kinase